MRTVKVGLEVDVGRYVPVVEGAAKATKDLDDKVEGLDRSLDHVAGEFKTVLYEAGKAGTAILAAGKDADAAARDVEGLADQVEELDRDLDKIPADAAKAGAAMKTLGGDVDAAAAKLQQIGDKSARLQLLESRIRTVRSEVKELVKEFEKTGDVEVFARLQVSSGELHGLQDVRKKIVDGMRQAGQDGATTFAALFQGGIIQTFSELPAEAKLAIANALAGAVLGASAAIGAALNGAIVAGIGTGAIAAGIAGQANDPLVRAAWKGFVDDVGADFAALTEPFARPAAYSANIFRTEWRRMLPDLEKDFEGLSKFVVPLASGVAQMFSGMGPGLSKLLDAAGPLLQVVADELPKFGREIGKAFSELSDSSEGAADGIRFLFLAMETLIVGTAKLISILSTLFHWIVVGTDNIIGFVDVLLGWVPIWGKIFEGVHNFTSAIRDSKDHVEDLSTVGRELSKDAAVIGKEFYNTADAADAMNEAFDRLFSEMMSLDEANLAVKEGQLELIETLKENGRTLDENTKKGIDNRQAINSQIDILNRKREAEIAAGNGTKEATEAANAAYAKQLAGLRQLLITMGYAPAEVDKIINKWMELANIGNITKTFTVQYRTSGTPQRGFSRYPNDEKAEGGIRYAEGGIRHAAFGMIVPPSNPGTLIAEPQTGGELLLPMQGISAARAASLMQIPARGYGLDVVPQGSGGTRTLQPVVLQVGPYQIAKALIEYADTRSTTVGRLLGIST